MSRALPFAIALLLTLLTPSAHAARPLPEVAVTTCGQVVPPRTLGYLSSDLDCTGFEGGPANVGYFDNGAAVYLGNNSKLDLRGFTLTGGYNGVLCNALTCGANGRPCSRNRCEVFGGTIVANGNTSRGIGGFRPIVHDVTITGFNYGIWSFTRLSLTNGTISDCLSLGVAGKGLFISNSTITNNGAFGISANTTPGPALHLSGSTVTGNGTAAFCGLNPCADVFASRRPVVTSSTCDTSIAYPSGNWDVCALD